MAKKKSRQAASRGDDKARFELRFDVDLYESVKDLAEHAGISVNRLMQGITRWAVEHAHVGEPSLADGMSGGYEVVGTKRCDECIWFGQYRKPKTIEEKIEQQDDWSPEPLVFMLDFREEHVVRTALRDPAEMKTEQDRRATRQTHQSNKRSRKS